METTWFRVHAYLPANTPEEVSAVEVAMWLREQCGGWTISALDAEQPFFVGHWKSSFGNWVEDRISLATVDMTRM